MADSFVHVGLNPDMATDYDAATGIHTLKLAMVTPANTDLHSRWGLNPKLATDQTAGIHTLKAKEV